MDTRYCYSTLGSGAAIRNRQSAICIVNSISLSLPARSIDKDIGLRLRIGDCWIATEPKCSSTPVWMLTVGVGAVDSRLKALVSAPSCAHPDTGERFPFVPRQPSYDTCGDYSWAPCLLDVPSIMLRTMQCGRFVVSRWLSAADAGLWGIVT